MKDAHTVQRSPVFPDFYPLEHDNLENDIIWNNSPSNDHQPYAKICESEQSVDTHGEDQGKDYGRASRCWDLQRKSNCSPVIEESFHCTEMPAPANYHSPGNNHPPLTNEDNVDHISTPLTNLVCFNLEKHGAAMSKSKWFGPYGQITCISKVGKVMLKDGNS